jgi:serine phosphatase RsbU (regulator of sigma subunit)
MVTASNVGGDFYDQFMVDDTHLALVVGDVSGHGMAAAMFMMLSSISLFESGDVSSRLCAMSSSMRSISDMLNET